MVTWLSSGYKKDTVSNAGSFDKNKKRARSAKWLQAPLGADNRSRTCTLAHWNLNPACLPIPPYPHVSETLYYKHPETAIKHLCPIHRPRFEAGTSAVKRWPVSLKYSKQENATGFRPRIASQSRQVLWHTPWNFRTPPRGKIHPISALKQGIEVRLETLAIHRRGIYFRKPLWSSPFCQQFRFQFSFFRQVIIFVIRFSMSND